MCTCRGFVGDLSERFAVTEVDSGEAQYSAYQGLLQAAKWAELWGSNCKSDEDQPTARRV